MTAFRDERTISGRPGSLAFLGGLIAAWAGLTALWGMGIAAALLFTALWLMRWWWPGSPPVPVTVGEVVDAVAAGVWPERKPGVE